MSDPVEVPSAVEPALVEHLREIWASEGASFHMPGHKGGSGAPPLGVELLGDAVYRADLSEMGGFDYLHGAESGLLQAQADAARLFGARRSWFLVNGASVGNIAAICSVVSDDETLLVARDSHRSVYAGIALSGCHPKYLSSVRNDSLDGLFGIDPADVESALARDHGIRAIHVTSPSYYGFTVPLAEIAEIAAAHGVPLIVDEAHGSHFAFHPGFPQPALACGADVVVHSPHKTLGSLTQSSLLHLQGELVDEARVDSALQMLQSSSPSALLLLSLSLALDEMEQHGRDRWGAAIELAERARDDSALSAYGGEITGAAGIAAFDPTKLVIDIRPLHTTGHAAARWLKEHRRINPEFADLQRLVFSLTMGDSDATVDVLLEALAALAVDGVGVASETHILSLWPTTTPEQSLLPRAGMNAPNRPVPLREAVGLVSAEMIVPYPPGVPLIVQGEIVSVEVIDAIEQLRAAGCRMVGISDPTCTVLRCVS